MTLPLFLISPFQALLEANTRPNMRLTRAVFVGSLVVSIVAFRVGRVHILTTLAELNLAHRIESNGFLVALVRGEVQFRRFLKLLDAQVLGIVESTLLEHLRLLAAELRQPISSAAFNLAGKFTRDLLRGWIVQVDLGSPLPLKEDRRLLKIAEVDWVLVSKVTLMHAESLHTGSHRTGMFELDLFDRCD